jgi:hypothetical protein
LKEGQGKKSPNFHSDKDEILAMAWVSASDNSIVSNGQKAKVFWADIHDRYFQLQQRSQSSEVGHPRSWNQLKGRFLQHIQVIINTSQQRRIYHQEIVLLMKQS